MLICLSWAVGPTCLGGGGCYLQHTLCSQPSAPSLFIPILSISVFALPTRSPPPAKTLAPFTEGLCLFVCMSCLPGRTVSSPCKSLDLVIKSPGNCVDSQACDRTPGLLERDLYKDAGERPSRLQGRAPGWGRTSQTVPASWDQRLTSPIPRKCLPRVQGGVGGPAQGHSGLPCGLARRVRWNSGRRLQRGHPAPCGIGDPKTAWVTLASTEAPKCSPRTPCLLASACGQAPGKCLPPRAC